MIMASNGRFSDVAIHSTYITRRCPRVQNLRDAGEPVSDGLSKYVAGMY